MTLGLNPLHPHSSVPTFSAAQRHRRELASQARYQPAQVAEPIATEESLATELPCEPEHTEVEQPAVSFRETYNEELLSQPGPHANRNPIEDSEPQPGLPPGAS